MKAAVTRAGGTINMEKMITKIKIAYEAVKKDNDFIYHEPIPDVATLTAIGKAALAKSLPIASPMSTKFTGMLFLTLFHS